MKTAGIIVEYNPFHCGHAFHIQRTREVTGADYVIAVMSGDFVQRGAPALLDKHLRTKMALMGGADLVLELPVYFAAGSAGDFAAGAVSLLDQLGCVDFLSFGSEWGDIGPFRRAAALLTEEPEPFKAVLKERLKQGASFPGARAEALKSCSASFSDEPLPDCFFSDPNNILGLEYCAALLRRKSSIRPVTIKREGAGYHDDSLDTVFSSAQAIRNAVYRADSDFFRARIAPFIPENLHSLWGPLFDQNAFLCSGDFTKELRCRLLTEAPRGYQHFADVSRELSDKLLKNQLSFTDWEDLCARLKTKELTYSRISRALLRILLSLSADQLQAAREQDYVPYARILGFRKTAMPLLSSLKKNSGIPMLSKLADADRMLSGVPARMLQKDILAAHLYESALAAKTGCVPRNEYTRQICIL